MCHYVEDEFLCVGEGKIASPAAEVKDEVALPVRGVRVHCIIWLWKADNEVYICLLLFSGGKEGIPDGTVQWLKVFYHRIESIPESFDILSHIIIIRRKDEDVLSLVHIEDGGGEVPALFEGNHIIMVDVCVYDGAFYCHGKEYSD